MNVVCSEPTLLHIQDTDIDFSSFLRLRTITIEPSFATTTEAQALTSIGPDIHYSIGTILYQDKKFTILGRGVNGVETGIR